MKTILANLALIDLTRFCKASGIDCSGSHLKYDGRFRYSLVTTASGKLLASVRFHKSSLPTHSL